MSDDKSFSVGEPNKLEGEGYYHVWKLKMKAIIMRKDLCQR